MYSYDVFQSVLYESSRDFSEQENSCPGPEVANVGTNELRSSLPRHREPFVLEASRDIKAGDVLNENHLCRSVIKCLANNPLVGPFVDPRDLTGRVAARDIPQGTVITGAYLIPLAQTQMIARLRSFWQKCR